MGGCRKYVICGFVPVDTSAPRGVALALSEAMKLIFKAERGDKQMWQDARCVISAKQM